RATIDLVLHQRKDKEFQDALLRLRALRESNVTNFSKYLEDTDSEDFKSILCVLNNYEFTACGIHEGAFDEELFKRMQYSVFLRNWRALRGCVTELRQQKGIPTLMQEFQKLATKWEVQPLKKYEL